MPKTLFCYTSIGRPSRFYEVEGNYSHLDGTYINAPLMIAGKDTTKTEFEQVSDNYAKKQAELLKFDFNEKPYMSVPTKDWDHYARVGDVTDEQRKVDNFFFVEILIGPQSKPE